MYDYGQNVWYKNQRVRITEILSNNKYYIDYTNSDGDHTIVNESELSLSPII